MATPSIDTAILAALSEGYAIHFEGATVIAQSPEEARRTVVALGVVGITAVITDSAGVDITADILFGIQRAARLRANDAVALAAQFRGEPLTYGGTSGRAFRARVAAGLPGLL